MDVEQRIEITAAAFEAAAESLAWAERARCSLPESPPEGSDEAEVLAWAEDTLMTMTELSELMAEAWERIAAAMESVAGIEAPRSEDVVLSAAGTERPSAGETSTELTPEDLLSPTSFLDAIHDEPPRSAHTAA